LKEGDKLARPSKSTAVISKNLTNEERKVREKNEKNLKGDDSSILPSNHLTEKQKSIFRNLVKLLKSSGILGNIDIYVLDEAAISIDRKITIESDINTGTVDVYDSKVTSAKAQAHKEFCRYMNELCMSPQSRAKFANANLQKKEEDPLIKALEDDD
jgi:P27 family predicted phage terminase small subunit